MSSCWYYVDAQNSARPGMQLLPPRNSPQHVIKQDLLRTRCKEWEVVGSSLSVIMGSTRGYKRRLCDGCSRLTVKQQTDTVQIPGYRGLTEPVLQLFSSIIFYIPRDGRSSSIFLRRFLRLCAQPFCPCERRILSFSGTAEMEDRLEEISPDVVKVHEFGIRECLWD